MPNSYIFTGLGSLVAFVALAGLSTWLTAKIRAYALARGMQDIPNERSSHVVPTPRGGGAAIVVITIVAMIVILAIIESQRRWSAALLAAGMVVAITGWLDDVRGLRARTRLVAQFFAAGVSLAIVGSQLIILLPGAFALTGYIAVAVAGLHLVWGLNSYNFMDGIDGLAAGQAVSVAAVVGPLAYLGGNDALAAVCFVVAAASVGFLILNWQPAKIFMGDVCSGFLGFLLAFIALWGEASGALPLTSVMILMGVFVVDSTYTLTRRLLAGERVYEAHRDHAYQHATQRGWSHARVSGVILLCNLLWLAPIAVAAARWPVWGWALVVIAYLPLLATTVAYHAGVGSTR